MGVMRATFVGADLSGARLRGVDLSNGDLVQTDFSRADLTGAKLNKADVSGANFRGVVGLGQIQGLDEARNRDKALFDAPQAKAGEGAAEPHPRQPRRRRSGAAEARCRRGTISSPAATIEFLPFVSSLVARHECRVTTTQALVLRSLAPPWLRRPR